jgi:hypothetical protein
MTVVSSREFISNEDTYKGRIYYEPDEDFYNSITIDELQRRLKVNIHQWYKEKNENNCVTEGTAVS